MHSLYKQAICRIGAKNIAIGAANLDSIPGQVKSVIVLLTARHHCDVSSELCCPVAKPRRWTTPLVTHFGLVPQI